MYVKIVEHQISRSISNNAAERFNEVYSPRLKRAGKKDHSDIHEKFGSEKTESTNIDNSQGHKTTRHADFR